MEDHVLKIISLRDDNSIDVLINQYSNEFEFPVLNTGSYREKLWTTLFEQYVENNKDIEQKTKALTLLRLLSRDKTGLIQIVQIRWAQVLYMHMGYEDDLFSSDERLVLEAMKCANNLVFHCPAVAEFFGENGKLEKIAERTKKHCPDSAQNQLKWLDYKLLFLVSGLFPSSRKKLAELNIAENLCTYLKTYVLENESDTKLKTEELEIVIEILKILFNIIAYTPSKIDEDFTKSVLRKLLLFEVTTNNEIMMVQNHVVNLLTNTPIGQEKLLYVPITSNMNVPPVRAFENWDMSAIQSILDLLKFKIILNKSSSKNHELITPALTVLTIFASRDRPIRKYLRLKIFPHLKHVDKRPEEGCTMRALLCKLLTSPILDVSRLVADFLFILCKENVGRMIKYTGYGNAAGLFAGKGLLGSSKNVKQDALYSSDSDSETEEYREIKHKVNPVTGCLEKERINPTENMTEEQKEYEAMQLVNLIDNLTQKGMIKPCAIGDDGKPKPLTHICQLMENLKNSESESD